MINISTKLSFNRWCLVCLYLINGLCHLVFSSTFIMKYKELHTWIWSDFCHSRPLHNRLKLRIKHIKLLIRKVHITVSIDSKMNFNQWINKLSILPNLSYPSMTLSSTFAFDKAEIIIPIPAVFMWYTTQSKLYPTSQLCFLSYIFSGEKIQLWIPSLTSCIRQAIATLISLNQ